MPSDPTDLIRRAQQGDRAAFEALYRAHAGRVYALCLRLTADVAQAEERTQDAFIRAWERLATFRGESAFSSWLYRLTVNEVLLGRRAERRRVPRCRRRVAATGRRSAPPAPEHRPAPRSLAGHRAANRATCSVERATGLVARGVGCRSGMRDGAWDLPSDRPSA